MSFTLSLSLLKHVHWVSDAIQPSHFLSPPSFALNLSQHLGLFQWVGSPHQVVTVLELQLQHQSLNEYSGLISIRIDWFDLLALQGKFHESPPALQFESINSLVLDLLYGPTLTSIHDYWKTHSYDCMDLCWQSDVSAFWYSGLIVIAFLQRSRCFLISRFQSPSTVILEPNKINSVTVSTFFPSVCHEVMGSDVTVFISFNVELVLSQLFHSSISP